MERGSCRVLGEFELFLFFSFLLLGGVVGRQTEKGREKGEVVGKWYGRGELRAEEPKRPTNLPSTPPGHTKPPFTEKEVSHLFPNSLPLPAQYNLPISPTNKKVTYLITYYPLLILLLHPPTKTLYFFSYKKSRYPRNHLFTKLLDNRNSQTHSGIYNVCKPTLVVDSFFGWRSWRFGV